MKILKCLACALLLWQAVPVLAFDDNRQGFVLGLGAGLHSTGSEYSLNDNVYRTDSSGGLASSFKIGGGIGEQFSLYFVHNASRFRTSVTKNGSSKDETAVLFMDGIGAAYYFQHSAPSGYLHAALGGSYFTFPQDSDLGSRKGGALILGGGYEFNPHIMLDLTLLGSSVSNPNNSADKTRFSVLQFTLNYLFY